MFCCFHEPKKPSKSIVDNLDEEDLPIVTYVGGEFKIKTRSKRFNPSQERQTRRQSSRSRKRSSSNDSGIGISMFRKDSDLTESVSIDFAQILNATPSEGRRRKSTGSTFRDSLKDEFDDIKTQPSLRKYRSLKKISMLDIRETDSLLEQVVLENGSSPIL